MTINELKSLLKRFGIKPNHQLGQNFLLSERILDQIVAAAELKPEDIILEIGPGLGVLTARLAQSGAKVFAIEKDQKLARVLRQMFRNKKHVKVINEDALFISVQRTGDSVELISSSVSCPLSTGHYKVVANIPYYITGKLLQNLLSPQTSLPESTRAPLPSRPQSPTAPAVGGQASGESNNVRTIRPSLIVLLLQKEVAERIVAGPGEMSLLSVSVQMYAHAEIVSHVGRENFYPAPDVDSAVVKISPFKEGLRFDVDEKKFFQLAKIGFSNKRKQLQNNLKGINARPLTPERSDGGRGGKGSKGEQGIKGILETIGLNPLARAQDLSLEDWKNLYDALTPRSTGASLSPNGRG